MWVNVTFQVGKCSTWNANVDSVSRPFLFWNNPQHHQDRTVEPWVMTVTVFMAQGQACPTCGSRLIFKCVSICQQTEAVQDTYSEERFKAFSHSAKKPEGKSPTLSWISKQPDMQKWQKKPCTKALWPSSVIFDEKASDYILHQQLMYVVAIAQ